VAFSIGASNALQGDGFLHFGGAHSRPHQLALKRLFDVTMATLGLLALSPLMLAVALLVKLTSRGPVFFAQPRSGLHGKPFRMLKFRSMVANAEAKRAALEALRATHA
jgi:lipopolysaccharide/colanic/teichoic acid biosynthesis glycosyltransferase